VDLARQANWSTALLAKECGVSVRTLQRFFAKRIRTSPKVWLAEKRRRRAVELLVQGSSVKETAMLVGYKQASTFSREFKKRCGRYPTAYALET